MGLHLGMEVPGWPPENIDELAKRFEDHYSANGEWQIANGKPLATRHSLLANQANADAHLSNKSDEPSQQIRLLRNSTCVTARFIGSSTTAEHRKAMFANMCAALIKHEQIVTTLPKAKELRPIVEKLVTLGKKGGLALRRQAISEMRDKDQVRKLFDVLASRYGPPRVATPASSTRPASATATTPPMAVIEFVDRDVDAKGKELRSGAGKVRRSSVRFSEISFQKRRYGAAFFVCDHRQVSSAVARSASDISVSSAMMEIEMPAYVISEVDVRDAAGFEAYRTIRAKAIAQHGGRYLVASGGAAEQPKAARRRKH